MSKLADPLWRHARALKAGEGARKAHQEQRRERGNRYGTKADAYAGGYRQGYQTAMAWWTRKWRREFDGLRGGGSAVTRP